VDNFHKIVTLISLTNVFVCTFFIINNKLVLDIINTKSKIMEGTQRTYSQDEEMGRLYAGVGIEGT
jgi:hypothetical protein